MSAAVSAIAKSVFITRSLKPINRTAILRGACRPRLLRPGAPRCAPGPGCAPRRTPKAIPGVIVHDSDRLQERIHDGRAHEAKAAFHEVPGNLVAQWRARRYRAAARAVHDRPGPDERPQVAIKGAELALQREERPRVGHGGLDLQAVTHDAGIAPQGRAAACIEARYRARLEVGERAAVAGALAQDGRPRQARLRALEGQHLEQPTVVVHRPSPFLVVIADIVRVGAVRPPAAPFAGVAPGGARCCLRFGSHSSLSFENCGTRHIAHVGYFPAAAPGVSNPP